ncbi:hypothetical protein F5890DRAFT_1478832, partial [Lentinula detonsa]
MFTSFLKTIRSSSGRASPNSALEYGQPSSDHNKSSMPGSFYGLSPPLNTLQSSASSNKHSSHTDARSPPTLSPLIRGLDSLHLDETITRLDSPTEEIIPLSPQLEHIDTLITAATMTSEPIDTSGHARLFVSSSEFYEQQESSVPDSPQSLDMLTVMQSLNAVFISNKTRPLPAFRPSHQFGRQSHLQSGRNRKLTSPSPVVPASPVKGLCKVGSGEAELIAELSENLRSFQVDVLDDAFDTCTEAAKYKKTDEALAFVKHALAHLVTLENRATSRAKMADRRGGECTGDVTKEIRESLTHKLRTFHAQLSLLHATFLTKPSEVINADYVYNNSFMKSNPINQVLVLLAVICNMIIGLSTEQCTFLLHTAIQCVKLGMSTASSCGSDDFTPSQKAIINGMPTSLSAALKRFGADGRFDMYASCPSCCYNNKATPLSGPDQYDYPETCLNQIVGETGVSICGTNLLTRRRDGSQQPIKPYLVNSLADYLTRCLADERYLQQSIAASDHAFEVGSCCEDLS